MTRIPRDAAMDSTLALMSEGYTFIGARCRRYGSDLFQARLLGRKAFCAQGEEAARMFYEPGRFTRRGAVPASALSLLQDKGSVSTLDGESHRRRKALFLRLMSPENVDRLGALFEAVWRAQLPRWRRSASVVLLPEVEAILCRAVCDWAGVPLDEDEVGSRTREFSAIIDGAGAFGPRNWRGQLLRGRAERWARRAIERIRAAMPVSNEVRAAYLFGWARGDDGALLDVRVAAVELMNVLRPTVAVGRFIVFAALALHKYRECGRALATDGDAYAAMFADEVRRFYPFVPAVAGRALVPFAWRGHHFKEGSWVALDLYGGDHDPRAWGDPENFRPERFGAREPNPFTFIPQGGGRHDDGHRCPGEWITNDLVKRAARLLTTAMSYRVPPQDLTIDLGRMPALPRSRFVICDVRAGN